MALTSEKDFMMSLSVVVEKAWMVWEEFAGSDSWANWNETRLGHRLEEQHHNLSGSAQMHTFPCLPLITSRGNQLMGNMLYSSAMPWN